MPMSGYGQFCPVAKAAEVLDQRWTLLVVRELVAGSRHFNEIHRGVPRMSRSLLSTRLRQLTHGGLVVRREEADGPVYDLTGAGRELAPVVEAIGAWGVRRMSALSDDDLDPALLLWDMHRRVDVDALPQGQTVLGLTFGGVKPALRDWWLLLDAEEIDVCDKDPGRATDVAISTPLRTLVRVWRGDLGWEDAVHGGDLALHGPETLRRQVPSWFQLSVFAAVPRSV
jgi:DNA-binding HxlR family transcriptional regulator